MFSQSGKKMKQWKNKYSEICSIVHEMKYIVDSTIKLPPKHCLCNDSFISFFVSCWASYYTRKTFLYSYILPKLEWLWRPVSSLSQSTLTPVKKNLNKVLTACCILSFGWFPGVRILEPTFWNTLSVLTARLLKIYIQSDYCRYKNELISIKKFGSMFLNHIQM